MTSAKADVMYQKKTVFVIGAGCSAEFDLPVGRVLRDQLFDLTHDANSPLLHEALVRSGVDKQNQDLTPRLTAFARGLHTKPSIDQYLHFHRDDARFVNIGKTAIAAAILRAERKSKLTVNALAQGMRALADTWFERLFYDMNNDIDLQNVERSFSNVSFICFNYDRCIEVGFFNALRFLTREPTERVAKLMQGLKIWHPYGTVGLLDYNQMGTGSIQHGFPVGEPHWSEVIEGSRRLRTFTEGVDNVSVRREIGKALDEAEQIVYMGFSFLDQNMKLLKAPTRTMTAPTFATTCGLSVPDASLAASAMAMASSSETFALAGQSAIVPLDATASNFMAHFGNVLRG